ncbi:hypothetical protein FOA52_007589 [Chlamydomonas sp. UWO 241]|nr:hypothetical protein FOA52_007589 [Chlamydomonas sp. UWO 241]
MEAEANRGALEEAGITHVLQVADGLQPTHPGAFTYMAVRVADTPSDDIVAHFPHVFPFIDAALQQGKGGVLVHCVAGVSRSASVLIGYLMARQQLAYGTAFRMVHAARPWVMPNLGFQARFAADRGQMITIVSAYSPTEAASDEEAGDFYLRVAALADKANDKRDLLIVAG